MSWNNQQPNLPFNPTGPERNPLNLSLNNPPYVPSSYDGPPQIREMAPLVAAACAIEIQNNAQKNPLRMFMYNQYSRDAFVNPDFDALVKGTLDYVALAIMTNRYSNPEIAIQNCVPQMVEMMCAINLRLFDGLDTFVDPNVANTLRNTIQNFDNTVSQIARMRQGGSVASNTGWGGGGQAGAAWGGGGQQSQWGSGGGQTQTMTRWGNPSGGAAAGGWSSQWGNTGARGTAGGSSGLFGGGERATASVSGAGNVGGKYSSDNPLKQPYASRTQEKAMEPVVEQVPPEFVEAPANSGKIKWKPSAKHPYIPAIPPSAGELWLRRYADGTVEPYLKEKEGSDMDYNSHSTGAIFGTPPRSLDMSRAGETLGRIEEGIREVNKASAAPDEAKATPEVTSLIKQQTILETSLEAAWLSGSLERLTSATGKVPDVFRVYAKIADPIVTKHDETDAVRNFGNSKTYIELQVKLEAAVNELSPELWGAVNLKMTSVVNRVLVQNLGLPDVSIDTFCADIEELIKYLGKVGQGVQQAFLKHQRDVIFSALQTLDEKNSKSTSEDFIANRQFAEGVKPEITYLVGDYSLTYLNCLSYELNIDLAKKVGTLVTKAATPILHDLLEGLFKDVEQRGNNYERHLLTTNDGRELEATMGYLNEESYLLTLIR